MSRAVEGDMFLNLGEFEEPRDVETQFITRQIGKHQPLFLCLPSNSIAAGDSGSFTAT